MWNPREGQGNICNWLLMDGCLSTESEGARCQSNCRSSISFELYRTQSGWSFLFSHRFTYQAACFWRPRRIITLRLASITYVIANRITNQKSLQGRGPKGRWAAYTVVNTLITWKPMTVQNWWELDQKKLPLLGAIKLLLWDGLIFLKLMKY